eukprot:CAMPEP_0206503374 /NCGR_PEP_ID=MMETSP0324_2-20121206/54676_1 /ASSEMBLY_ACC=CAM_ASM_000836 /TAXON_ID=2866 /ORGANISM="Crypthecodinium cohnii, Strain Seligo" /LENGTH=119 /DNA_ID=CAMNT_0053991989 /DNA_START=334 /DNA_END=693 /DNA_ORIENTATION=+
MRSKVKAAFGGKLILPFLCLMLLWLRLHILAGGMPTQRAGHFVSFLRIPPFVQAGGVQNVATGQMADMFTNIHRDQADGASILWDGGVVDGGRWAHVLELDDLLVVHFRVRHLLASTGL